MYKPKTKPQEIRLELLHFLLTFILLKFQIIQVFVK